MLSEMIHFDNRGVEYGTILALLLGLLVLIMIVLVAFSIVNGQVPSLLGLLDKAGNLLKAG